MNIGDIASAFIRAAEIDRNNHEHVGPAPLRAQRLGYVHDYQDKLNWRKEVGDKLAYGDDPLSAERKAFFDDADRIVSAEDMASVEAVFDWLTAAKDDAERRALWAWARAKAGGKSFRRWCFNVEGIHPETGRRRKDRAIERIKLQLSAVKPHLHDENPDLGVLPFGHEIGDVSDTVGEDAGKRDSLNSWLADDAFASVMSPEFDDFSWADRRNKHRRQREAKRKKEDA